MYYTYMVRCADNSIYTGMTNNLEKRINEHINKSKNGAKYTKSHNAIKLETAWKSKEKSLACKLEYQRKRNFVTNIFTSKQIWNWRLWI